MCPHYPIDSLKCHEKLSVFLKRHLLGLDDGSVRILLPYKHGEASQTPRTKPHKTAKNCVCVYHPGEGGERRQISGLHWTASLPSECGASESSCLKNVGRNLKSNSDPYRLGESSPLDESLRLGLLPTIWSYPIPDLGFSFLSHRLI